MNLVDRFAHAVREGQIGQKQFAVTDDDGQQVVEIVRYTARKLTDAVKLLGLPELFLQTLALRDVAHDGGETNKLTGVGIGYGKHVHQNVDGLSGDDMEKLRL